MLPRTLVFTAALCLATAVSANTGPVPLPLATPAPQAVSMSPRPLSRDITLPNARWGTKGGRSGWSLAVISSLRSHASRLPETVPADISTWCPSYPTAGREMREAFWLGLVSALAKHESTYKPTAVGGGGKWYGLLQILPSTARLYGCQARTAEELKNPRLNLACGLRIMAKTVARDGVVSRGMRGVAADWGPFHSSTKREDMIKWTRSQNYCTGLARSLRPLERPGSLMGPRLMASGAIERPLARPEALMLRPEPMTLNDGVIATQGRFEIE